MCSLFWRSFLDTPCQSALDLWPPFSTCPLKCTVLLQQLLAWNFVQWSGIWSDSLLCVLKIPMASGCAGVPGAVCSASLCFLPGCWSCWWLVLYPTPRAPPDQNVQGLWHCQLGFLLPELDLYMLIQQHDLNSCTMIVFVENLESVPLLPLSPPPAAASIFLLPQKKL